MIDNYDNRYYYCAMNSSINTTISEFQRANSQGVIAHLMVISHYIQKKTLDTLVAASGYQGLSLAYVGYISLLMERDYSPGELARKLGVTKQACSKTVGELEKHSYIERRSNPEDSRSKLLSLTNGGRQLLSDGSEAAAQIQQEFAHKVGSDRLDQLNRVLLSLCNGLEISLPSIQVQQSIKKGSVNAKPMRLNMLLAKLSDYFHEALTKGLENQGFSGLKPNFSQVLGLIGSEEGGRIQYISTVIGVSKQAIAVIAQELEELGYIVREPDPDDKRQIILRRTSLGDRLLDASAASVCGLQDKLESMLSSEDYQQLEATSAALYFLVADNYGALSILPAKVKQLSEYLLDELGMAGARTLAQQLMSMTRGKV